MSSRDRSGRDVLLYTAMALGIVGYAIVAAIYTASYADKTHAIRSWIGFGLMTLLLLAWLISDHRAYLNSVRLWLSLIGLLAVHIAVGTLLIWRFQSIPYAFFAVAVLAEGQLMSALLARLMKRHQRRIRVLH